MSRDDLVTKARSLGVPRPELMTRVELSDEIVRRTESDPTVQRKARGFLGVARDLVASVVETGLNLSDAAALIRGDRSELSVKAPPPVATVTLAEIYATQGHVERALHMLEEVLAREPEHTAARALSERLTSVRAEGRLVDPSMPRAIPEEAEAPASEPPEGVSEPPQALSESPASDASLEASPSPPEATAPPRPASIPPPRATKTKGSLLVLRTRRPHPLVCWDLEELKPLDPEVRLEIECLGFVVGSTGPERREVVLPVAEAKGSAVLSAFDGRTVVRAALGYRLSGAFVPLAIASEFSVQSEAIHVRFRPPLVGESAPTPVERALVAEFVV